MEDEIRLFYDLTAEKTADEWYNDDTLKPSIMEFMTLLPARPRVLDWGCGPGHESMRLTKAGAEVVGIDFSPECIRIARQRCPEARFEVMDFRRPDPSLGKFDGVFACASLIHVHPDELPNVIKDIRKFLFDEGYAVLIVQDGEGINEDWSRLEVDGSKLNRTVYRYPEEHLLGVCRESGLTYLKMGYLAPNLLEYGWRSYIVQATMGD